MSNALFLLFDLGGELNVVAALLVDPALDISVFLLVASFKTLEMVQFADETCQLLLELGDLTLTVA